jgi:hypothetical protein
MSADSLATAPPNPSNPTEPLKTWVSITIGTAPTAPAQPGTPTATPQAGPQISLTWRDNANNETGFIVERCGFVTPTSGSPTCSDFAKIAAPGPRNNTGNVTYVDATVNFGYSYRYRVAAFNAGGVSAYATMANPVVIPAIPLQPTNFTVSVVKANGNNYTASLNWASSVNPANFTIQRASDPDFTANLATSTAAGTARTLTQTVSRNFVYYYRIRANNSLGGSSAWTKVVPFPIRTGN